jgi:hypothetical protein
LDIDWAVQGVVRLNHRVDGIFRRLDNHQSAVIESVDMPRPDLKLLPTLSRDFLAVN